MCETDGFDVLLEARGYDPLVPPELVALQIWLHFRKQSLNMFELWARDFRDLLAPLSPLIHDVVEVKDELLGEVCYISTSLGVEETEGEWKATMGQVLVERELCVDLDQFLSRIMVVIELRAEDSEQRFYFLFRAQAGVGRAHGDAKGSGDDDDGK